MHTPAVDHSRCCNTLFIGFFFNYLICCTYIVLDVLRCTNDPFFCDLFHTRHVKSWAHIIKIMSSVFFGKPGVMKADIKWVKRYFARSLQFSNNGLKLTFIVQLHLKHDGCGSKNIFKPKTCVFWTNWKKFLSHLLRQSYKVFMCLIWLLDSHANQKNNVFFLNKKNKSISSFSRLTIFLK